MSWVTVRVNWIYQKEDRKRRDSDIVAVDRVARQVVIKARRKESFARIVPCEYNYSVFLHAWDVCVMCCLPVVCN